MEVHLIKVLRIIPVVSICMNQSQQISNVNVSSIQENLCEWLSASVCKGKILWKDIDTEGHRRTHIQIDFFLLFILTAGIHLKNIHKMVCKLLGT